MITKERNELLKRKNVASALNKTVDKQDKDNTRTSEEVLLLNQTIEELQAKLEAACAIDVEKRLVEEGNIIISLGNIRIQFQQNYDLERDRAQAELELKEEEVIRITTQIEDIKAEYKKEEEQLQMK